MYFATRSERAGAFWRAADRCRTSSMWDYQEIVGNHGIAANQPEELAALLLELVEGKTSLS